MALTESSYEIAAMPPGPIDDATAWYGSELTKTTDWIYHLTSEEVREVDAAVRQATGLDIIELTAERFPLPNLALRLGRLVGEVQRGRGFVLLRGLPIDDYSLAEAALAYYGIGSHMGSARSQNAEGHVLGHVLDIGHDHKRNAEQRGYRAAGALRFHTDSVDIVGLFCWRAARHGGKSRVVSAATIHNEVLRRRPELAPELFRPIHRDRRGEVPEGKPPWWIMPIFQWYGGTLFSHFSGEYIRSVERFAEVPRFTELQHETFALIEEIADDPEVHLRMELQPGDMQFVNNHALLHGREDYQDWPEPERRRYLLRLWICPPEAPALPPSYAERYGNITIGDRGGIVCPGTELKAPLEPI